MLRDVTGMRYLLLVKDWPAGLLRLDSILQERVLKIRTLKVGAVSGFNRRLMGGLLDNRLVLKWRLSSAPSARELLLRFWHLLHAFVLLDLLIEVGVEPLVALLGTRGFGQTVLVGLLIRHLKLQVGPLVVRFFLLVRRRRGQLLHLLLPFLP